MENKSTDIIIPIYNEIELTKNCLESIIVNTDSSYRLILIDNASSDETKRFLEDFAGRHKNTALVRNELNVGWVKAVNQGIKLSEGPYICIMNNDTIVRTNGWLLKLVTVVECGIDIGLVNPRFEIKTSVDRSKPYIEVDFCRGYCILIKRSVIERVGALDEAYGLGYYDDDDFSMRAIRAGFRCVRASDVFVEHVKDSTFSTVFTDSARRELHEKNKQLFYSKWGKRLRVLFIITKTPDRPRLKDLLLMIARRQHIVYLWNLTPSLSVEHSNVRQRRFPKLFSSTLFAALLGVNMNKSPDKQYSLLFSDDRDMADFLSKKTGRIEYVNIDTDADKILKMIDTKSRT